MINMKFKEDNNNETEKSIKEAVDIFRKLASSINPRNYAKLSPEEREKRIENIVAVFFNDFNHTIDLDETVKRNDRIVPWIIAKFSLTGRIQSKIAIRIIANYEIIWQDVLSNPQKIVDYLWLNPSLRDTLEKPETIEWINRNTLELREFLTGYVHNPPDQKISYRDFSEAQEIIDRMRFKKQE